VAPSATAQNTRCQRGGSGCPPDVSMSTTNDAESLEVTKKTETTLAASNEVTLDRGSASSIA